MKHDAYSLMSTRTSRARNAGHASSRRLWLSLSIVPLLIVVLDVTLFPRIFEQRQLLSALDATTLFENRIVRLGTIHSISINVVLENLKNEDSLVYLSSRNRTGLVVSAFVDPERADEKRVFEGDLARTVRLRLQTVSRTVALRMADFIARMGEHRPGDVLGVELNLSESERARFPVDRLIVVVLNRPGSKESAGGLETALAGVVADADRADLKALAVPCIGYQWKQKNSVTVDPLLGSVFKTLNGPHRPFDLFISLYSDWPTPVIEKAVGAVNHAWAVSPSIHPGVLSSLYRGRYRIVLLLTTICLLACTRRAQNTVKSFLLILAAYLSAALGLAELLGRFAKNYPEQPIEIALLVSWVALALGFPVFVGWDVKDVFRARKSKSSKRHRPTSASARSTPLHDSRVVDGDENFVDSSQQKRGISKVNHKRNRNMPLRDPAALMRPRTSGEQASRRKLPQKTD